MPSKSHRVASKQAKLKKRRRGGKGAGQEFDAGPTEAQIAAREDGPEAEPKPRGGPTTFAEPAATALAPARRTRRSRQAAAEGVPLTYSYLSVELRRIGILAMGIFIILAAASFALSG